MAIRILHWERFQHFKNRRPIWIKLYRELRHKREWRRLSGDAAKLLVDLWMMAAEQDDIGVISSCLGDLAYDLRWAETGQKTEHLHPLLQELISQGFIESDITMISPRYQDDTLEKRREETEIEKRRGGAAKKRAASLPPDWKPNATHAKIATEERVSLEREVEKFRDWVESNGATRLSWDATFRTWLRRAGEYSKGNSTAPVSAFPPETWEVIVDRDGREVKRNPPTEEEAANPAVLDLVQHLTKKLSMPQEG